MIPIPDEVAGRPVTNRGTHMGPIGYFPWMNEKIYWTGLLRQMHISWAVLVVESDAAFTSGAARALLESGVIPIIRFKYELPNSWTMGPATQQLAGLYQEFGAPLLVQFANEPFDPREWRNGEVPEEEAAWALISYRWNQMAQITVDAGGYPGFPDGPGYTENPFCRILDPNDFWANGLAWYSGHHYAKGRPIDYPYDGVSRFGTPITWQEYLDALGVFADHPHWNEGYAFLDKMNQQRAEWANPNKTIWDDDVCWRGWEKIEVWAMEAHGRPVQMAQTEGGWCPRDRAGSDPVDIRWPYTTPEVVADRTLDMYASAPTTMFAVCSWLLGDQDLGGAGAWENDAWHGWAFEEQHGRLKPAIWTLINNPPNGNQGDQLEAELLAAHASLSAMDEHIRAALEGIL